MQGRPQANFSSDAADEGRTAVVARRAAVTAQARRRAQADAAQAVLDARALGDEIRAVIKTEPDFHRLLIQVRAAKSSTALRRTHPLAESISATRNAKSSD